MAGRGGILTDAGQSAEGDSHGPAVGADEHEGREEGHCQAGGRDGLDLDFGHVGEAEAAEDLSQEDAAADDGRLQADFDAVGCVEGADDLRPEDGERVVYHGANGRDADDGVEADVAEQARWHEGLRLAEVGLCFWC